ncbi:PAS domain-containing sensor histidine kinase [Pseudomonas sp. 102515]|uniref:PAS domain-containing sensor histidine kinase n=1 Tax=Pseudomonas sp. 102515 TaxID=3071568 RepID=UPI002800AA4D|nr:PAS domain-containing sensor histidine kinase [Pseudomonas sp. 102515]MDQ7912341.1 PAS domain-containing sensor histidine kinase [Pseudomonas sp. 102515]
MQRDKAPESYLPMLYEEAPCGLVVTKEDGTILRTNLTFSQWVGFRVPELCGMRFQDLLTMGGRIFHQTHLAPLMKLQGSVAEVKLDLKHHDGQKVTMLLNGIRRERDGGIQHELALFTIYDRDKYERELLKSRKLAEELLQQKTAAEVNLRLAQAELSNAFESAQQRALFAEQMVAIVSHDLKNPLTAIKMGADVLARGERTSKESNVIGWIKHSADRAERLIADLLDFTLVRVGRGIVVSPQSVDLHDLVHRSIEELRVTFPNAWLVHETVGVGNAYLDADRVQQLIGNLVSNSVAYGDLAQPISIASRLEHDMAYVSVQNEGPVIPQSLLTTLFEPLIRGAAVESGIRSVGLGLFIVNEIVKAHGGQVSVTSNELCGTSFTVSFPLGSAPFVQPQ